jgi:6-pyruvoyltetrahydropterin/6-carboxytetrahydropterin synthase
MIILTRTVRFSVNPPPAPRPAPGTGPGRQPETPPPRSPQPDPNGFAAIPSMRGLGRHYELVVKVRGEINPATGYLINIKEIDHAVRAAAIPLIAHACLAHPEADPIGLMPGIYSAVAGALPHQTLSVRFCLSPYYSVEMQAPAPQTIPAQAATVLLRQRFDFAASHRLHIPGLSQAQNQALFGKCNNPSGHGHNYQFEPCVEVRLPGPASTSTPAAADQGVFSLQDLERLAYQTIIDRYDHKNLTIDLPEFQPDKAGVNASVEHIARTFYERLAPAIAEARAAAPASAISLSGNRPHQFHVPGLMAARAAVSSGVCSCHGFAPGGLPQSGLTGPQKFVRWLTSQLWLLCGFSCRHEVKERRFVCARNVGIFSSPPPSPEA